MRSFAIWYELDTKVKRENIDNNKVTAKVHINFWSQLSYLNEEDNCFFDFGILVNDISNIASINLYCPFFIEKKNGNSLNVYDLGAKISNTELVDAIFNENYITTGGQPKRYIVDRNNSQKTNENKQFIIYSLEENNEIELENCKQQLYQPDKKLTQKVSEGTIIKLKIENLVCNSDESIQNIKEYYFRIRIRVAKNKLFAITQKVHYNNPLRDSFFKTEVVDFRLNDIRSFNPEIKDRFFRNFRFDIKSINFLIMRNITDSIYIEGDVMQCRLLEYNLWEKYIDGLKENMVAYHIKKKASEQNSIDSFNAVIKIQREETNTNKFIIYLFVLILLGLATNFLYDCLLKIF